MNKIVALTNKEKLLIDLLYQKSIAPILAVYKPGESLQFESGKKMIVALQQPQSRSEIEGYCHALLHVEFSTTDPMDAFEKLATLLDILMMVKFMLGESISPIPMPSQYHEIVKTTIEAYNRFAKKTGHTPFCLP